MPVKDRITVEAKPKKTHLGLVMALVPLVLNLVIVCVLGMVLNRAEMDLQKQIKGKAILSQSYTISQLLYDAGAVMGGYSATKSTIFSDRYSKIKAELPADIEALRVMVGDDPARCSIVDSIQKNTVDGIKIIDETKAAVDDRKTDVAQFRAKHYYKQIRQCADTVHDQLKTLTKDERYIGSPSGVDFEQSRNLIKCSLVLSILLNIVVAVSLIAYYQRAQQRAGA